MMQSQESRGEQKEDRSVLRDGLEARGKEDTA